MENGVRSNFRRLLSASALSNLADGIFVVALPLLTLRITSSPAQVAGVSLAGRLPWLLFALQAGALADRLDRKRTMVRVDTARGLLIGAIGLMVAVGHEQLWALYGAAFALGVGETLFDTAAQSILPTVVGRDHLDHANGQLQATEITTNQFVGPPLGGVLAGVAIASAFFSSAFCYLAAPLLLRRLQGSFRPAARGPHQPMRQEIAEGVRWLWRHRLLRTCALLVGGMNLAEMAIFAVFPLFAVRPGPLGLTDAGYGVLLTTMAVGSVAGSALTPRLVGRFGRARMLFVSVLAFAVQPMALLTERLPVIAFVWAAGSAIGIAWNIITVSLRQRIVPDHLLGRINSAYRLLAWGTMPIGAALGGVVAELSSVRTVIWIGALGWTALAVATLTITETAILAAEREAAAERDTAPEAEA